MPHPCGRLYNCGYLVKEVMKMAQSKNKMNKPKKTMKEKKMEKMQKEQAKRSAETQAAVK